MLCKVGNKRKREDLKNVTTFNSSTLYFFHLNSWFRSRGVLRKDDEKLVSYLLEIAFPFGRVLFNLEWVNELTAMNRIRYQFS